MTKLRSQVANLFGVVPNNVKGIGYMLSSAGAISGANGIVQFLSQSVHVFEIAFIRQFLGFIVFGFAKGKAIVCTYIYSDIALPTAAAKVR